MIVPSTRTFGPRLMMAPAIEWRGPWLMTWSWRMRRGRKRLCKGWLWWPRHVLHRPSPTRTEISNRLWLRQMERMRRAVRPPHLRKPRRRA